jgi:AraC-like DNA-binding protein
MPRVAIRAAMIRASVLNPLVHLLDERGQPTGDLLDAHGMSRARLADPYEAISLARYVAIFEAAAAALDDPAIGITLGRTVRPADLGPLGLLFTAAPTRRAALSRFSDLLAALQGGTQTALERKGDVTVWIYRIDDSAIWPRRQDAEFSLAAICSLLKSAAGSPLLPLEIHFEHGEPASGAGYEEFGRAALRFGQPANRLIFANDDLDRPIASADRALTAMLERHIRDLTAEPEPATDVVGSVERLISLDLGREPITVERLSATLGVAPRTLQRRLSEAGTSVRRLLREHRQTTAQLQIRSTRRSQSEIAEALGYSDGTAFWRAFKSWTDRSPSAYRKKT